MTKVLIWICVASVIIIQFVASQPLGDRTYQGDVAYFPYEAVLEQAQGDQNELMIRYFIPGVLPVRQK